MPAYIQGADPILCLILVLKGTMGSKMNVGLQTKLKSLICLTRSEGLDILFVARQVDKNVNISTSATK